MRGYVLAALIGSAVSTAVTWRLARRAGPTPTGPVLPAGTALPDADEEPVDHVHQVSAMWGNIAVDGGDTEGGLWGAILSNDSEHPIRYAHLTVRHRRDGWLSKGGFHKVAPHSRLKWSAVKVYANASGGFGPSIQLGRQLNARRAWRDPTLFAVELTFQDSDNRFWLVDEDDSKRELNRDLMIWLDDERAATCDEHIRTEFQPKFGVQARFRQFPTAEQLQQTFNEYVDRPDPALVPPDVFIGAHDWLGKLAAADAIREVALAAHQRNSFDDVAIRALTRDGRLMGVPYSSDTVALIANRDLVPDDEPIPATFTELLADGERRRRAGGVPLALQMGPGGDMYHSWPVFASVGGTMAGLQPDGSYAPNAVWQPAIIAAFEQLAQLREQAPYLFDTSMTRNRAVQQFLSGDTPYLITACGNLGDLLDQGMRVRSSTVPPLGAFPARAMVTVMTFYLPCAGRNERVAQDLLTYYLARPETGIELNQIRPWPPVQRHATEAVARQHPALAGFIDAKNAGLLMPVHPGMRDAWDCLLAAQLRIAARSARGRSIGLDVAARLAELDLSNSA